MEFEPLDGSTVSWSPPDPPNGMIIYYNIRITHTESGELEWFIELFTGISIDVSDYVDSNGYFSVQVHVHHVCKENKTLSNYCGAVANNVSFRYVHMFLCCQVQAVTIEGPGNFSSPVTVAVGGCKESDNSVVIGVPVAIVVVIILITMVAVIILLTIVSGLLITYTIR